MVLNQTGLADDEKIKLAHWFAAQTKGPYVRA
jgi:hypothetical protein